MRLVFIFVTLLLGLTTTSFANNFGTGYANQKHYSWADTPAGKFVCNEVENIHGSPLQELKLGNKLIYRQPDNDFVQGGNTINKGIFMSEDTSLCPDIIQNKAGYVIYQAQLSSPGMAGEAPSAYIFGYYVINFNVTPATATELAQLDLNHSQAKTHFTWDKSGFTLNYFGYPNGVDWQKSKKKPKSRIIRFDFASQRVKQIK